MWRGIYKNFTIVRNVGAEVYFLCNCLSSFSFVVASLSTKEKLSSSIFVSLYWLFLSDKLSNEIEFG